jgi:hypothetical protein
MTLVLVSPDRFTRHVPLGFAFRDASDLGLVGDGLDIRIVDAGRPFRQAVLGPTPSGTWMTPRLPGLSFELAQKPADWPAKARSFKVSVDDPFQRFLPLRFEAALPVRGRFIWPAWAGLDQAKIAPLLPAGAPAGYKPNYLPLFPSIACPASGPRSTVRAQLAERQPNGTDKPAAWAVMTVTVDGKIIALGIAGANGSIAAIGGYPALPSQTPEEATAGRDAVTWSAEIAVYWDELTDELPKLDAILGQLSSPARIALKQLNKDDPLPGQPLTLGRPLTLVSLKSANVRLSTLYLKPN